MLAAALEIAERNDLVAELMLARGNSGSLAMQWDLPEAAEQHAQTLALARRRGDRFQESVAAGNLLYMFVLSGRWEEGQRLAEEMFEDHEDRPGSEFIRSPLTILLTLRGELEAAQETLTLIDAWARSDDDELRAIHTSLAIRVHLAAARPERALEEGEGMLSQAIQALGTSHDAVRNAWPDTVAAALELRHTGAARELLTLLSGQPPGHIPPYLRAHLARAQALLAATEGAVDRVEQGLTEAIDGFRSLAYPYWLARTQTDLAAWLHEHNLGSAGVSLLDQARATLEELGAASELARARELRLPQSIG